MPTSLGLRWIGGWSVVVVDDPTALVQSQMSLAQSVVVNLMEGALSGIVVLRVDV